MELGQTTPRVEGDVDRESASGQLHSHQWAMPSYLVDMAVSGSQATASTRTHDGCATACMLIPNVAEGSWVGDGC